MPNVDLKELVEFAADTASKKIVGRKKPMAAFCVVVSATGERTIIELLFRNRNEKTYVLAGLRQLMRDSGAVGYAIVSEAWAAPDLPDPGCDAKLVTLPADHPDRYELLIAVASDGFNSQCRQWKICRDYKGAVSGLQESDVPSNAAGPLLNLLGGRA